MPLTWQSTIVLGAHDECGRGKDCLTSQGPPGVATTQNQAVASALPGILCLLSQLSFKTYADWLIISLLNESLRTRGNSKVTY